MDYERFAGLLELLYEGLACPDRWGDFLAEVSRQLGCDKAAIVFHDRTNRSPAMGFYCGFSPEAMRDYNAYYGTRNPAARPILQTALRTGSWHGLVRSVVDGQTYKKSEYYDGWGRQNGVYYSVVGAASDDRKTLISLSLMRSESADPLGQDAVELMRLLTPHLKRAFQIHKKLESLRACAEGAKAALDQLETGLVGVDGEGRVVLMNERAEVILGEDNAITVQQGRLTATNSSDSNRLEGLVRSAAMTGAGRGVDSGGAMMLQGSQASRPLPVTVTPFCSSHLFTEERPCALVFLTDPAAKPRSRAASLSTLFGLTPAECRLAGLLLEGLEVRIAAEKVRVTAGTARFMLKSIFQKTATHRQSQLIRLLLSLPGEAKMAREL